MPRANSHIACFACGRKQTSNKFLVSRRAGKRCLACEEGTWLCDGCIGQHDCEMVRNSPRRRIPVDEMQKMASSYIDSRRAHKEKRIKMDQRSSRTPCEEDKCFFAAMCKFLKVESVASLQVGLDGLRQMDDATVSHSHLNNGPPCSTCGTTIELLVAEQHGLLFCFECGNRDAMPMFRSLNAIETKTFVSFMSRCGEEFGSILPSILNLEPEYPSLRMSFQAVGACRDFISADFLSTDLLALMPEQLNRLLGSTNRKHFHKGLLLPAIEEFSTNAITDVKRECTLETTLGNTCALLDFVKVVRGRDWGFLDGHSAPLEGLTSIGSSALLLLGSSGSGTSWHCDRCTARNIAFGLVSADARVPSQDSLAIWCLVHPEKIKEADNELKSMGISQGVLSESLVPPEVALSLRERLGSDQLGRDYVCIIYQTPGSMVCVPPGWLHTVLNLKPNIKVAWDDLVPAELPRCIQVWRDYISPQTVRTSADYSFLFTMLKRWCVRDI